MQDSIKVETYHSISSISIEEWEGLMPQVPDSLELFRFIERVGMAGYSFHSIVVRWDGRPVLYLPLFEVSLELCTMLDGLAQKCFAKLTPLFPRLLKPRILAVGFVEGEWSAVGVDYSVSPEIKEKAWSLALSALNNLGDKLDYDLMLYLNFLDEQENSVLPESILHGFKEIMSYPSAILPITYSSVEEYLNSLSKGTRKDLKRKIKKSEKLKIIHTREIGPWLDTVYRLYCSYVAKYDFKFGVEGRDYFANICTSVPGAEFVLYFLGDRLLAFNLVVASEKALIDKHYAMEPDGRGYAIYFASWLENIRYCIEKGIPLYMSGPGNEATKAYLGGKFLASVTMFKHRNWLMHRILALCSPLIAYKPDIAVDEILLNPKDIAILGKHLERMAS